MQDEVSKHAKKIYTAVKDRNHTLKEKVIDVITEILIIVFAVTLSISLHSWSEHRHEQKEAKEFLKGLKNDLTEDIKELEENKNVIAKLNSNFKFVSSLKKGQLPDTVISHYLEFDIPETHPNTGRYEGFKSSGKMGTIENDSLKEKILVYYQRTLPDIAYSESYVNSLQLKILYLEIDEIDKMSTNDFVTTAKTRSLLGLGAHNFQVNMAAYDSASKQAKQIVSAIDKQTKE
jgi:hypothetical protein